MNHPRFIPLNVLLQKLEMAVISLLLSYFAYGYYRDFVVPKYYYMGFNFSQPQPIVFFSFGMVGALLALLLPVRIKSSADLFSIIVFLFVILPVCTVPLYTRPALPVATLAEFVIIISICFVSLRWLKYIPRIEIPHPKLNQTALFWCLMSVVAVLLFIVLRSYDVSIMNLKNCLTNISNVYEIREGFRESNAASGNRIAGYALGWLAKAALPILLLIGLEKKNFLLCSMALVLQLALFSVSGHKNILLGIFLVGGMYFVLTRRRNGIFLFRLISYSFLFFIFLARYFSFGIFAEVFTRRMFIVPGALSGFFVDFFGKHGFDQYSHSMLKILFSPSHYSVPPAFVIGLEYLGRPDASANVNMFAYAFANYGYIAIIAEWATLLVIIKMFDSIKRIPKRFLICSILLPAMAVNDTPLPTAILTHGFALAFIMSYLYGCGQEEKFSLS